MILFNHGSILTSNNQQYECVLVMKTTYLMSDRNHSLAYKGMFVSHLPESYLSFQRVNEFSERIISCQIKSVSEN